MLLVVASLSHRGLQPLALVEARAACPIIGPTGLQGGALVQSCVQSWNTLHHVNQCVPWIEDVPADEV